MPGGVPACERGFFMRNPFNAAVISMVTTAVAVTACFSAGTCADDPAYMRRYRTAGLAPASRSSGEDSEIVYAAKLKKLLVDFRKELEEWVAAKSPYSVDYCLERFRKVFHMRDDWDAAQEWLNLDEIDPPLREVLRKKVQRIAADVIKRKLLVSLNDLMQDWSLVQLTATTPQRLKLVDAYLFSEDFARTFVDLSRGPRLIVDFGVGERPVTTIELAKKAQGVNGGIRVVGVDGYYPAIIVKDGDDVSHYDEEGELIHLNGKMRKDLSRETVRDCQAVKYTLEKESGGKDYRAPDGREIWFAGIGRDYKQRNLKFIKGSFDFPIAGQADVIRAINVFIYYKPMEIAGALLEFEKRLKEGGVLIAGWQQINTDFGQLIVYQKRGGKLVPVEMLITGISEANVRRALQITRNPKDEPVIDPFDNASRCSRLIVEKFFAPEVAGVFYNDRFAFFSDLMIRYIGTKKDMRIVMADLLHRLRTAGLEVTHDQKNGFLRFPFNENGVLADRDSLIARQILLDVGVPGIMQYKTAPTAFMPYFLLRMRQLGITSAGEYVERVRKDKLERDTLRHAVSLAMKKFVALATLTGFFRDHEQWKEKMQTYLPVLIRRKVKNNDYALCVKSVGSSTGQEVYSVGMLLYRALRAYAETELYGHVASPAERRALSERWIDRWKIRLEAYDRDIDVLEKAYGGVYDLEGSSYIRGGAVEKEFVSYLVEKDGVLTVDQRIRGWLVPVCIDVEDLSMLPLLSETRGDIIVCNVLMGHLIPGARAHVKKALMEEAVSLRYPTFFMTDDAFGERKTRAWVSIPEALLEETLIAHGYDVGAAARALGVPRMDLLLNEVPFLKNKVMNDRERVYEHLTRLDEVREQLRSELRSRAGATVEHKGGPKGFVLDAALRQEQADISAALDDVNKFLPLPGPRTKSDQYDTPAATGEAALAPRSEDFGESGEIVRTAEERAFVKAALKRVNDLLEDLYQELLSGKKGAQQGRKTLPQLRAVCREIFRVRDDPASLDRWLPLTEVSGAVRQEVYRKAAKAAGDFIGSRFHALTEDVRDHAVGNVTKTAAGRLAAFDSFILSDAFARRYVDLRRGGRTVVDLGVGVPPLTTIELAQKLMKTNPQASVVGVDIALPYLVIRGPGIEAHFDRFGRMSVDKDNRPKGKNAEHKVKMQELANKLLSGGERIGTFSTEGYEVWFMGEDQNYGLQNLRFVQGGFDFQAGGNVDLIRFMNVLIYYYKDKLFMIAAAMLEFEKRLAEGGVLLAGWKRVESGFGEIVVYQKRKGRLVPAELWVSGIQQENLDAMAAAMSTEPLHVLAEEKAKEFNYYFLSKTETENLKGIYSGLAERYRRLGRDADKVMTELVAGYALLGYNVSYEPDCGLLRFQFDGAGNLDVLPPGPHAGPRSGSFDVPDQIAGAA